LITLSASAPQDSELRAFALISRSDADLLEVFGRAVSAETREHAVVASMALRMIVGLVQRVQSVQPGSGFRYTDSEVASYKGAYAEAVAALDAIVGQRAA
jgi:hypothetical protein